MRSLDDIKKAFLAKMEEGEAFTALTNAVQELEDSDGHGMSQHDACVMATRWAIEAGYFDADDAEVAEAAAEEVMRTGQPS